MIALYSFFFKSAKFLGVLLFWRTLFTVHNSNASAVWLSYGNLSLRTSDDVYFKLLDWNAKQVGNFFHHLVAAWIWFSVAKYRGIVSASFWALNTVGCIWNSRSFQPISTWQYLGCNANSCYGIPMWSYNNLSNHVTADNLEWPSFQYWTPFLTQYLEKCQLQRSDVMHALFRRLYLNWRTIQGH